MSKTEHVSLDLKGYAPAPGDRNAIIGQTGSGKSYATRRIVEFLIRICPTIVIDPTGVWWGLRSTAAGEPILGHPAIPIIGGAHGDIPLDPKRGAVYARWIASRHSSAILDLSGDLGRGEARRFVEAFVSELYRIKGTDRVPTHIVIDEADEFAPQKSSVVDTAKCLAAMDQLVRRGRSRGIGFTLITQRPAVLNKDVLNMAANLVFLKVTGPTDINAVGEWVKYHGTKEDQHKVMGSLSKLPVGLGWWWMTESDTLVQTRVTPITTFDSMKAPSAGEALGEIATIDLGALTAEIAGMVEEAQASDPAKLKARIAALELELKHQSKNLPTPAGDLLASQKRVQLLTDVNDDLKWQLKHWRGVAEGLESELKAARGTLRSGCEQVDKGLIAVENAMNKAARPMPNRKPTQVIDVQDRAKAGAESNLESNAPALRTPNVAMWTTTRHSQNGQAETLSKSARAVLDGLRWVEVFLRDPEVDDRRLALITGIAPGGSTMRGAKAELKKTDAIEYPRQGVTSLTTEGRKLANEPDPAMTREGLHDQVCKRLSERPASLLRVLIAAYPEPMDGPAMADAIGLDEPNGSSMRGYKAELAGMGLIEYPKPGWARAVDALFPETLR